MNFTTIAHDAKRKLEAGRIGNVYIFETDLSSSSSMVCGTVNKSAVEKPIHELKQALEDEYNRCREYVHGH